jgi:hypothetical protein
VKPQSPSRREVVGRGQYAIEQLEVAGALRVDARRRGHVCRGQRRHHPGQLDHLTIAPSAPEAPRELADRGGHAGQTVLHGRQA